MPLAAPQMKSDIAVSAPAWAWRCKGSPSLLPTRTETRILQNWGAQLVNDTMCHLGHIAWIARYGNQFLHAFGLCEPSCSSSLETNFVFAASMAFVAARSCNSLREFSFLFRKGATVTDVQKVEPNKNTRQPRSGRAATFWQVIKSSAIVVTRHDHDND
jgi:hypothetical protein